MAIFKSNQIIGIHMRHIIILSTLLLMGGSLGLYAQCPKSSKAGIHVVQAKENLYRISKQYNISLQDICSWNGITINQILPMCKELIVSAGKTKTPAAGTASADEFTAKAGTPAPKPEKIDKYKTDRSHRHIVKKGETIKSIADNYGYTEKRFREMNGLARTEELNAGSTLVTSTCYCSANTSKPTPSLTTTNVPPSSIGTTTVTTHSTHPNNISSDLLTSKSENSETIAINSGMAPQPYNYMSAEEYQMIQEINLLRSNPAAYIPYVQEYRNKQKAKGWTVHDNTINELIAELGSTSPRSSLIPMPCVHNAARNHGQDMVKMGKANHIGTDGSWPWDRVKKTCPTFQDGNENLVGGAATVRDAVILLLIDHGIPTRGHRANLLNPHWTHVACHKVGNLGDLSYVWVQKFGQL